MTQQEVHVRTFRLTQPHNLHTPNKFSLLKGLCTTCPILSHYLMNSLVTLRASNVLPQKPSVKNLLPVSGLLRLLDPPSIPVYPNCLCASFLAIRHHPTFSKICQLGTL